MAVSSVTVALTGSGGTGVMTAGQMLLDSAGRDGYYGLMTRSLGPQIRGGEAAAFLHLGRTPVRSVGDRHHLYLAFDWLNVERFQAEMRLDGNSVVLFDTAQGTPPADLAAATPHLLALPLADTAAGVEGGRVNMVGLGLVATLLGLSLDSTEAVLGRLLGRKGPAALAAARAGLQAGATLADRLDDSVRAGLALDAAHPPAPGHRWHIAGNEATGLGAITGGIHFVAAYPITPATDILEYMAPALQHVGGHLVQAEDELASINMVLGASYGGVPSLTATSGPGYALMTEGIGLGVAAELPCVIVNVQRGGPSTGIPTKSEQADLNMAVYGLHGDAPHVVVAPTDIGDCLTTTQWAVHLAETLQCPAVVLSDQIMGQARAIIDRPDIPDLGTQRKVVRTPSAEDQLDGRTPWPRHAPAPDGVSPMALPGTPGCTYTADGLEHDRHGTPSTQARDHQEQLDKRRDKLLSHDYGPRWLDRAGDGPVAVICWGSTAGPVREAVERRQADGRSVRLLVQRLLSPALPEAMAAALDGVETLLVVEQSHGAQYLHYLRAHFALPARVESLHAPGPLPLRPATIAEALTALGPRS